ncbi:hypothetical protein HBH98_057880 [Parastagonospora nodorum]|nr:hypothetical protein HBH53_131460 [Parastagonospora nodorum]KAH3973134.1 hypothetical protein HBH52_144340 [Parastagonospora nodorum]KAH4202469.1 hypothetical protein HBH42_018720 [Parastagonospora nodorum]KAH4349860.1 hypothetical protein HBH98_057880 [Parastagonospora nodorum]KAH4394930.1 hypothetical protein HBH97_025700 [Parastagonospora nodorum]
MTATASPDEPMRDEVIQRCRGLAEWQHPDKEKKSRKKRVLTAPGRPLQALRLNPLVMLGEAGIPACWSKMRCTQLQITEVVQPLASSVYARLGNGRRSR